MEIAPGRWSIADCDAPRGRDRQLLEARRDHLRAAEPADRRAIGARVARLFLRFPAASKFTPEQVAAYASDLQRFPLWAIDKGFASIIDGTRLKAADFPPTSPIVQAAVRDAMQPVFAEIGMLSAVLDAEVFVEPTAEKRARVRQAMDGLSADLKAKNGPPERHGARDARDAVPARPLKPYAPGDEALPPLSPELRGKLGIVDDGADWRKEDAA